MNENQALVSIIILNFNGQKYLEECLRAVLNTNYPKYEVILVDNGSTDSSLRIFEANFGQDPRIRLFRNAENLGFSAGNNLGIMKSHGDYIVFLNNDTVPDPFWLTSLVNAIETDHSIGIAGSTILSADGKTVRGAGGVWSDYLLFLHPAGGGKPGDFVFRQTFEVSFATGCSMIVRKDFLDEIGLFEPKIPANYDDTLLSIKTWLAGKRVVSVSDSRVRHIGGATFKKFWNQQSISFSLVRAKACLLFDLYHSSALLAQASFIFHLSIATESFFLARNKRMAEVLARIHVPLWLIRNFRFVWKNRLSHWSNPKISSETLISKFVRIRLKFPLCVMHSKISYSVFEQECSKYEETISSNVDPSLT